MSLVTFARHVDRAKVGRDPCGSLPSSQSMGTGGLVGLDRGVLGDPGAARRARRTPARTPAT